MVSYELVHSSSISNITNSTNAAVHVLLLMSKVLQNAYVQGAYVKVAYVRSASETGRRELHNTNLKYSRCLLRHKKNSSIGAISTSSML